MEPPVTSNINYMDVDRSSAIRYTGSRLINQLLLFSRFIEEGL